MKLGTIVSSQFNQSYQKLINANLSGKTMFKLKGLSKRMEEEAKKHNEVSSSILHRYCDIDENGEKMITKEEDGRLQFQIQTHQNEVAKEMNELNNMDIDLGVTFDFDEVEKANLTTMDLMLLDGIVADCVYLNEQKR